VTAVKIVWFWHKNGHEEQEKRTEDPDMNPCSYAHIFFAVLGFELKAFTLSHETRPIFVQGFSR
jgi:hypothetical protein